VIHSWTLRRFKAVQGATLRFRPLTVFAGANSSGKSTVIQSMLLTAQTVQTRSHNRPAVLNGSLVRLGAFDDVITQRRTQESVTIGFEITGAHSSRGQVVDSTPVDSGLSDQVIREWGEDSTIRCEYLLQASNPSDGAAGMLRPVLASASLTVVSNGSTPGSVGVEIKRSPVASDLNDVIHGNEYGANVDLAEALAYALVDVTEKLATHMIDPPPQTRVIGVVCRHFLPVAKVELTDLRGEEVESVERILNALGQQPEPPDMVVAGSMRVAATVRQVLLDCLRLAVKESRSTSRDPFGLVSTLEIPPTDLTYGRLSQLFLNLPKRLQPYLRQRILQREAKLHDAALAAAGPPRSKVRISPLPKQLVNAAAHIEEFFMHRIVYLGPLRDEPKAVYPLTGVVDAMEVGLRGEHTAAVLDVYGGRRIEYIPTSVLQSSHTRGRATSSLREAIGDWLTYMGLGFAVETEDLGKLGHAMRIWQEGMGRPVELPHLGVGVSQVLPILVVALLAPAGATLIFEQPELHLHPKVQARLADFFVTMTELDKQCVIETHSEHLINRLRLHAAKAPADEVAQRVVIYFVESRPDGASYQEIEINEYGVIENWPSGFFDEAEESAAAILRQGALKLRQQRT
jgi:predicted ATPase